MSVNDCSSTEDLVRRYRLLAQDARLNAKQSWGAKRSAFASLAEQWERMLTDAGGKVEEPAPPNARRFWTWSF